MYLQFLISLLLSMVICSQIVTIHPLPSPSCVIKYGDKEEGCASINKIKSYIGAYTHLKVNRSVGELYNQRYQNLTVLYKKPSDISSFAVVQEYSPWENLTEIWEIVPTLNLTLITYPAKLFVFYIPSKVEENFFIHRISANQTDFIPELPCKKNESETECQSLFNSSLSFRQISSTSLELKLARAKIRPSLEVELVISPCKMNCIGSSSNCQIDTEKYAWNYIESDLNITINRTSFYCARIAPQHECCKICTETIYVISSNSTEPVFVSPPITYSTHGSGVWFNLGCPIFLGIIVFLSYTNLIKGKKMFTDIRFCRYRGDGIEAIDDEPLNSNSDHREICSPSSSPVFHERPIEVFLLYKRESDEFLTIMDKFRNFLSLYVTKVWDPFDKTQIEEVSENKAAWVQHVLSLDQVKVVLVETEVSIKWYSPPLIEHHLDDLFSYAYSALHNNFALNLNYKRVFTVRFNLNISNNGFENMVPCTRYKLPEQINSLITDLTEFKTKEFNEECIPEETVVSRLQEFQLSLNTYTQNYQKNLLTKENRNCLYEKQRENLVFF